MIRIVVVDDHPIVRKGIVALLSDEPDLEVVAEAAHGTEALAQVNKHHPDLVLTDLRMPGIDGTALTAELVAQGVRVLVLTTYETDAAIVGAIEAGAHGYLLKASPPDEILAGVRAVASGHTALSPAVAVALVQAARRPALSPRELEVLGLVAQGHSNPEIAAALFIGEATVKTHLQHVFEKLGVTDRTRAVTKAHELGLLG